MFADRISLTMQETLLVAVAGIAVVILELALITVIILGLSKTLRSIESKLGKGASIIEAAPVNTPASAPVAAPAPAAVTVATNNTPVLVDVDDRTAAVIMAIVSDQSGIPLNQLNFKTIKKVED